MVCSHRGPVSYRVDESGVPRTAWTVPGGMVPLVLPMLERFGGRWIFAAISDADRHAVSLGLQPEHAGGISLHMLDLPRETHRRHYEDACVGYLGQVFTYELGTDVHLGESWACYRQVNRMFAHAVTATAARAKEVLVAHDYHLMLLAAEIRAASPRPLRGLYFHHMPWCEPDYFARVPAVVCRETLTGLLTFNAVGFYCDRWAQAFLRCCERFLPHSEVTPEGVVFAGRRVSVIAEPAPLDVGVVRSIGGSSRAGEWVSRYRREQAGRWTIVRVDRVEPWKNALRGFLAFESLLERRPDLAAKLWFLAIVSPARTWRPDYRRYFAECRAVVDPVNDRWRGRAGHAPITLHADPDHTASDRHRALAGLRIADAVLVDSTYDGFNLVAEEALIVGEAAPVVVLSRNTGVYEELTDGVLGIDPFDVERTGRAMERAHGMTSRERLRRASLLRARILERSQAAWLEEQVFALTAN